MKKTIILLTYIEKYLGPKLCLFSKNGEHANKV